MLFHVFFCCTKRVHVVNYLFTPFFLWVMQCYYLLMFLFSLDNNLLSVYLFSPPFFFFFFFSGQHLYYGVLGNAAWAIVSGCHLFRGGRANKQGIPSKVDFFLMVDVGLALFYCVPDLLIPDVILHLPGVSGLVTHMWSELFCFCFTTVEHATEG